ncbi:NAD(P)H-hydrate dehydratase [Eleftheria terrae]|uniref:NAD(P)H-hydrate dehydratase n=1 Tax=Eleftheria terrae TaxID=1597781 RepID=UPI00263A6DB7|nr:NAD(P)H-hydrate dehydratase [Eleftheria terrae]WKB53670.1 NAD(P)H-hydrate dehydratase [Eleftheria terrae]
MSTPRPTTHPFPVPNDGGLQAVLPAARSGHACRPLHGVAKSRTIEAAARQPLPPFTLMQRAGQASARLALAIAPHAEQVWIAAGPGNNGGDGLEAAMHLHRAGKATTVSLLADPQRLPTDAQTALARARAAGVPIVEQGLPPEQPARHALAVDAVLGLGSSRAPQGRLAEAVARLRQWPGPVLALDLPTGLDADTGQPLGGEAGTCVRADHTLSLLTLKPGLFTGQGRDFCGAVWFDDLGIAADEEPDAWLTTDAASLMPRRAHAHHKGSFGDVLVLAGAPGMTGAALLASRAALHAGAGRVYASPLDEEFPQHDGLMPELMFRTPAAADAMDWSRLTVVCGCGGGEPVRQVLPRALGDSARLVLDADALNALAADSALRRQLQARRARGQTTVLTPHPLEAARLLRCSAADVQAGRIEAAQELVRQDGCVVVLKGSGSVVAAPGQVPAVNASGNAALATAGTGDVLAGWLGGLWAQGLDGFDAARLAVWTHGAAADRWLQDEDGTAPQRGPLTASQLLEALARAAATG